MTTAEITWDARLVRGGKEGTRRLLPADLWSVPRPSALCLSPDGRRLLAAIRAEDVASGKTRARLHEFELETSACRALTHPQRDVSLGRYSPDGTRIAFLAKDAGDDKAQVQVFVLPADGGEAEAVGTWPLGAFDVLWMPDGRGLLVGTYVYAAMESLEATASEAARRKEKPVRVHATEERFYRFWDRWLVEGRVGRLVHVDLETGRTTDWMAGSSLWFSWLEATDRFVIRSDGREVLFDALSLLGEGGRLRADVYRIDASGSTPRLERLTADEPDRAVRPRYLPGERDFVYGRTEDPNFYADRVRLARRPVAGGPARPWLEMWDRTPESWSVLADGSLLFAAEDDGRKGLYRLRADANEPERLCYDGTAEAPVCTSDGVVAWMQHDLSASPCIATARTNEFSPRILYAPGNAIHQDIAMAAVYDVSFEGARGDRVRMFVLLPPEGPPTTPLPLIHMIHGGPHGTFGDLWQPRWNAQAFAARGHVVALVDFHGSTGYGQEFARGIQGQWGDMPAEDIHRATDVLVAAGWVDPERVAIAGGSYGGYLVSWLACTSDRFVAGVNHAGVFDLALQYASDATWGRARNMGGDLWSDAAAVDRWNPARHVETLSTPMLVVHGERDYRVPVDQGLLCYGILKAKGVPARLLYFEDENHWVLKPENSRRWCEEVFAWLDRYLVPTPPPRAACP